MGNSYFTGGQKRKAIKHLKVIVASFDSHMPGDKGNISELARRVGVSHQAIGHWLKNGWIPTSRVSDLVKICEEQKLDITLKDLRPDLANLL